MSMRDNLKSSDLAKVVLACAVCGKHVPQGEEHQCLQSDKQGEKDAEKQDS